MYVGKVWRHGSVQSQEKKRDPGRVAPEWPHNWFGKAVRAGGGAGGGVLITQHALVLAAALGTTRKAITASALTCQKLHIIECPILSPCFLVC